MRPVRLLRLALATALVAASAGQAASENVLRWASAGGVLTWDPHGTTETPSLVGFRQVYEALTIIDADLSLRPALATERALPRRLALVRRGRRVQHRARQRRRL